MTAFLIAGGIGLVLTPLATRLAWATGFLDHPEARKLHTSATALLGGAVVFVCGLATVLILRITPDEPGTATLVGAGACLAILTGLVDDRIGMRPSIKLMCQAIAAGALIAAAGIPDIGLPPVLGAAVALVFLMALMNAVNFLDNMNGMVGGLAAIALIGFAIHSLWTGSPWLAAAQLAVAGACVGFLPYNFPKARIFLGDAGSLFLGYSLGASAMLAFQGAPAGWGRVGVFLMLAYPAFDMSFVVVNRVREGRKVYEGGKDHSNHRLASVIRCQKKTVLLTWFVGAALSASGLVVLRLNHPVPALLLSVLWILTLSLAGRRLSSVPVAGTRPQPLSDASPTPRTSSSAS